MIKYTLYVGLNDKETKRQNVETVEACKIARNIILKYTDGATIYNAVGFYTHSDGTVTIENTLRIELFGTAPDALMIIIETLKAVFNQETIIKETQEIHSEYC